MQIRNITKSLALVLIGLNLLGQEIESFERKGLVLGAGIGFGSHFQSGESLIRYTAPNLRVGFMLNSNWALLIHAPGGTYSRNGEMRAFEGLIPTAQYWFGDRLYFNAGIGLGIETTPIFEVDFEAGPPSFNGGLGLMSSFGYEFKQWGSNKTVDLQLRALYGNIRLPELGAQNLFSLDLVIGINLY